MVWFAGRVAGAYLFRRNDSRSIGGNSYTPKHSAKLYASTPRQYIDYSKKYGIAYLGNSRYTRRLGSPAIRFTTATPNYVSKSVFRPDVKTTLPKYELKRAIKKQAKLGSIVLPGVQRIDARVTRNTIQLTSKVVAGATYATVVSTSYIRELAALALEEEEEEEDAISAQVLASKVIAQAIAAQAIRERATARALQASTIQTSGLPAALATTLSAATTPGQFFVAYNQLLYLFHNIGTQIYEYQKRHTLGKAIEICPVDSGALRSSLTIRASGFNGVRRFDNGEKFLYSYTAGPGVIINVFQKQYIYIMNYPINSIDVYSQLRYWEPVNNNTYPVAEEAKEAGIEFAHRALDNLQRQIPNLIINRNSEGYFGNITFTN